MRSRHPRRSDGSDSEASSSAGSYESSPNRIALELEKAGNEDVAIEDDVEVTEGGWMCQTQRYEKFVGSKGREIVLKRMSKKEQLARRSTNLKDIPKLDNQDEKPLRQKSVMSYIHHSPRSRRRKFIELERYIIIRSPLVIKVLDDLVGLRPVVCFLVV